MKISFKNVHKFLKFLSDVKEAAAGVALITTGFGIAYGWVLRQPVSDNQISMARKWLVCLGIVALGFAFLIHYTRLRRLIRSTEREFESFRNSTQREGEQKRAQAAAAAQPIFLARMEGAQKPSDLAFHVLKWFYYRVGPLGGVDIQTVAHSCQIDRNAALEAVKELWNAGYIRTVMAGPGEWNGRYAVTALGGDCVDQFGT